MSADVLQFEQGTDPSDDRVTLYRMWSRTGVLLYVGITGRGMRRMFEHASSKAWWQEVDRISLHHFATGVAAANAETIAIRCERPKYNKRDTYHWTKPGASRAAIALGGTLVPFCAALLTIMGLGVGAAASMIGGNDSNLGLAVTTILATGVYTLDLVDIARLRVGAAVSRMQWLRCSVSGIVTAILVVSHRPSLAADAPSWLGGVQILVFYVVLVYFPISILHLWCRRVLWYDAGSTTLGWVVPGDNRSVPATGTTIARWRLRLVLNSLRCLTITRGGKSSH